MKDAAMTAVRYAREAGVPVVLTLGTRFVIESDPSGGAISSARTSPCSP